MSDTELEAGDRVRTVNMPSERSRNAFGSEPSEHVGTVVKIVEETKHTGVNSTLEQTLAVIECDDGTEKRVNVEHLGAEIDSETGGVTIQILDEDEEDEEDDVTESENEAELVTDGGEDVAVDVTDEEIEAAIDQHDDPDHPDVYTVDEVRGALERINEDVVDNWDLYQDAIDDDAHEIVHEDRDVVVLADHTGHFWSEQLDVTDGVEDDEHGILYSIVTHLHHTAARKSCDYSWSASTPVVVAKTDAFRAGEQQALREIARRTDNLGSVARAVDTLATEVHGWGKSDWAQLTGRNPSTVTRTTTNE